MEFDGFDWDLGNRDKCQNHGVPIEEIEHLFDTMPRVGPDMAHSTNEQRFRAIGRDIGGPIFVCGVHLPP